MKIGYQLFSALPLCQTKEGLIDTIKKIAAMGYDGVEFCNYQGIPAAEMKALLAECGIEGFNSHVQLERWEADAKGEILYAKEAGIPCVTIPWMAPGLRNEAGYAKIKAMVPELVAMGKEAGVRILYHNHDFEFAKEGNGYVLDSILASDDGLELELDTFWAHYAKVDPVAYLEEKKEKLGMIHIKDYASLTGGGMSDGNEMPTFCAIGTGKMENQPVIDWGEKNQVSWIVVEQDNSQIPVLDSAKLSIEYLKK